jgi:hypothetical protein
MNRQLDLYHRSMDHVIADLNKLRSTEIYLCYADNRIRLSNAFYHVLVLEGAEVAAATMCDTRQCPVCTCPHQELDRTHVAYPYQHKEEEDRGRSCTESTSGRPGSGKGSAPNKGVEIHIIVYDIIYDIENYIVYAIIYYNMTIRYMI